MIASKRRVWLALCAAVAATGCGRRDGSLPGLQPTRQQGPATPDELPAAHGKHVDFDLVDSAQPASSDHYILPHFAVTPYTQWMANNGYCGELSSVEAGMGAGQWMSQFNARLICGTGLSQSGPDGFCAAHDSTADYNAQLLFEAPNPGDQTFASAPTCLANSHLAFQTFDYHDQESGLAGYQQFLSWVKTRVIAGDTVAIGVFDRGGTDPQYDHEVTVSRIGTNHSPTDPTYYDDDVLYFEDHGVGGSSFTQGYAFASLAQTRDGANASDANSYSILIPGGEAVNSGTGGDGVHVNPHAITPANYGFAVSGPVDPDRVTLPVTLAIVGSSVGGVPNKSEATVGFNFESPAIGDAEDTSCTNVAPEWMGVTLQATVGDLTPGVAYNLYEYDFSAVTGLGGGAALGVPDAGFNARADLATHVTHFVADAAQVTHTVETTSDRVVVLRAVRADAP